jgi:hypothetical protein
MSSPVEITANLKAFLLHFFGTESTALLPSLLKPLEELLQEDPLFG